MFYAIYYRINKFTKIQRTTSLKMKESFKQYIHIIKILLKIFLFSVKSTNIDNGVSHFNFIKMSLNTKICGDVSHNFATNLDFLKSSRIFHLNLGIKFAGQISRFL